MGVGLGLGFGDTESTRAHAGTGDNSSDDRSTVSGSSKAQRRMGWVKRARRKSKGAHERASSRFLPPSLPPPSLALPPPPPLSFASMGFTGRRKGPWKGGVKTCRVVVEELRGQMAEDEMKESKEARKQPSEKSDESMDWREALKKFRVP